MQGIALRLTALGSYPKSGLLSVDCFNVGFLWVFLFPPTVLDHADRQIGYAWMSVFVWCPVADLCPLC